MAFTEYEESIINRLIEECHYHDIRDYVVECVKEANRKRNQDEGHIEWRIGIRPEDIASARRYLNTVEDWGESE